jgi:hypothetical protein
MAAKKGSTVVKVAAVEMIKVMDKVSGGGE